MAEPGAGREEISVILPSEPPELIPGAARALLKILLKAYEKQGGSDEGATAETD